MTRLLYVTGIALSLAAGSAALSMAEAQPASGSDAGAVGRAPATAPSSGADDSAAPQDGKARPSGAQVLPLPAPDASTARGQERGNAALRANKNPSESSSQGDAERSGDGK